MQKQIIYLHPDFPLEAITATDKEIIVIIPSEEITLLETQLPKLSNSRLAEALPFALEDQLLADVDDLHFASGPFSADSKLSVCVVAKQKMRAWLEQLKQHDISPSAIVPNCLCLPFSENTWQVLIHNQSAIVRTNVFDGFACELDNLESMLAMKFCETNDKPLKLIIHNYNVASFALQLTSVEIIEKIHPQSLLLSHLSMWIDKPINLLQGAFRLRKNKNENKKIWQTAGLLAVGLVSFLFVSNLISFFILNSEVHSVNNQIHSVYQRIFPNATAMNLPKERITKKLNELSHQENNPIFAWLGDAANALHKNSNVHLQEFEFQNNQLNLKISSRSSENLDELMTGLKNVGLNVKTQDIAVNDKEVNGTMIITENRA